MSSNATYQNPKHWRTLRRRLLLNRPPWMTLWEEDVQLPSGYRIEGYLVFEARPYAMVFALTEDGRVPLVYQYKHGLRRMAYDLPAGYLDAEEDPLTCARRELQEETGLCGGEWHYLGSPVVDSNRGPTQAHLFLAVHVSGDGVQHLDPSEYIEVQLLPLADVIERARAGEINGLASVANIFLAVDALRRMGYMPA